MPRTARSTTPRGRILAVAGAAAALAGAGTAAAASASAATIPARPATTAAVTTAASSVPAPALAAGLTINAPRHVLTTTAGTSPLAPASTAATPAAGTSGTGSGSHGAAVTTAAQTGARHAASNTGSNHAAAGRHAGRAAARHHAHPAGPYQMYDSVTPSAIPGGKAVATYADGPYAATPAAMHGKNVTWIDTNGTDPAGATVLDVEPGDATPAGAATWAHQRLDTHPHATAVIYTMRSEWTAAQTAIHTLPAWQQHHIRWWIADPTGTPHLVPGSNATQWYWGTHYDISTVNPSF